MVDKLFIDTWGWLTLHDKWERYHQQATQAYQQAIAQSGQIYTTDYILDETFTFFFRRLPAPRAEKSMKGLLSAFWANNFHLIRINEERFTQSEKFKQLFYVSTISKNCLLQSDRHKETSRECRYGALKCYTYLL